MFKKENDQYEEFPLAFTSPACDIWESLYNIKDMENYGNLTACNVEKVRIKLRFPIIYRQLQIEV